jgi:hypothetical protein
MLAVGGLQGVAESTTSTVIAILSLLAVAILVYGFGRAVVINRRPQIVVTDIVAAGGSAELPEAAMLSPLLRQCVERHINDQRKQIARVGDEILAPASRELEPQLDKGTVEYIQRAASNSIETLSAALRAVAPETAERFLGLFSAILPPPRGLSVAVVLLQRGSVTAPRLGTAVEVVGLNMRPLASAVFWEDPSTMPPTSSAQDGITERILFLLEPLARWIAVRLVVTLMVSAKRGATSRARQGLRRLLAGGLFLAAMRDFPAHALAFGEQACDELRQARDLICDVPLPVETLAGVRERMGWARRRGGDSSGALDDFRSAADLWEEAEKIARKDASGASQGKLPRLLDRRLKAQLETDEPALQKAALAGLDSLTSPAALRNDCNFLYNRACLYAQASRADPLRDYRQRALRWLGLAIVCNPSLGDYSTQDPVLAPIRESIAPFLACLRSLIPRSHAQYSEVDAEALVRRAIDHVAANDD